MIDEMTKKPIKVHKWSDNGGLIWLPASQLGDVRQMLDGHAVRYWVGESLHSFNGGAERAEIMLSNNQNPHVVQDILDRST